jgi:hypothetical protein
MRSQTILALLVVFMAGSPAYADSLRCGSKLVSEGDSSAEVREKCGTPDSKRDVEEPVQARGVNGQVYQVGTTRHEVWRYRRSQGSFPAVLTFDENGVLKKIDFEK